MSQLQIKELEVIRSKHHLYGTWHAMISRCENPDHLAWKFYGGRGIKVCRRWHIFENFLNDMSPRPEGKTLDRYPNKNGDYKPGNVRWATWDQQHSNRRSNHLITFRGRTLTVWQWADAVNMKPITLLSRIRYGWPIEDALTIPTLSSLGKLGRRVWKEENTV
jgi:hypothetical protein